MHILWYIIVIATLDISAIRRKKKHEESRTFARVVAALDVISAVHRKKAHTSHTLTSAGHLCPWLPSLQLHPSWSIQPCVINVKIVLCWNIIDFNYDSTFRLAADALACAGSFGSTLKKPSNRPCVVVVRCFDKRFTPPRMRSSLCEEKSIR